MSKTDDVPADVSTDPRWASIVARDRSADGTVWYSVTSTGIFCRPSCPSRLARSENVVLHDTLESARATGCRPCKRCNPAGPSVGAGNASLIEQACRLIEGAEEPPSLGVLAAAVKLSPGYFHRLFKAHLGITPKVYASAHRAQKVRRRLHGSGSVSQAMYEAGFNSSGRFYGQAPSLLGMTPGRYRRGGVGEVLRFAVGQCSLGAVLVASSGKGIAAILLGADAETLVRDVQDRFSKAVFVGGDADYERTIATVVRFVDKPTLGLDLPLDVRGTAFQQRVWQALREIPAGTTATYTEVARRIGLPKATRAVAAACGANRIAVAIPCHRVVRNDGALSGYRWGIERKSALLSSEQENVGVC